ncbi:MAG TPA: hypothetical protein DCZ95_03095 [Verrucomicrobia bacterium]|nr:MAG: hypothetical protein A2X46_02320 [Lentisphaerae bacterium GWF2_57_35]HBA83059.1 hypothetical protein [Verrucomicrobiota bacterium]
MVRVRILLSVLFSIYPFAGLALGADPLFEVPRLDGIRIDGQTKDWGDRGFRVEMMKDENGRYLPVSDFDAGFRLGWNTQGLLVLIRAQDDVFAESPSEAELWSLDGVEMYMATRKGGSDMVQPCITPGMDPLHPTLRWHIHDYRQSPALAQVTATVDAASARMDAGYVIEACIPWSNLGLDPSVGDEIAFQIYVNDADGPEKKLSAKWFPRGETHADTKNMHRVILSTNTSAPSLASAEGSYENMQSVKISVFGTAELAGKSIAVEAAGRTLATGAFKSVEGRATALLNVPMPPRGERYPLLDVMSGGQVIATASLPSPEEIASKELIWSEFKLVPFSFVGERLPAADFANRGDAEKLIGAYANTVQYYDAEGHAVVSAVKTGRYRAILQIQPEQGRPFRRFLTAYRHPDEVRNFRPWKYDPHARLDFPQEFGLEAGVLKNHTNDVNRLIAELLMEATQNDQRGALLLAGLHDAQSEPDSELSQEPTDHIERQGWVAFKREYYGMAKRFPKPFVAPQPVDGLPAPELREGSCAEAGVAANAVEKIDALLENWAVDADEAFAVCLARHGVVFFHKAYGLRDGAPMTVDTPSWMASITKLMSGTLMMMLVDQNLVRLDDRIEDYLPPFRGMDMKTPLTVRHLYTHTSGLWDHWGDHMNDLEERVAYHAPYLAVGERFQYNGVGFALGGKIIELVSGEAVPLFYKHHLLGPLGMTHTRVGGTSGDAASTPLDMARLGQMLLNGGAYGPMRYLSEETFRQMLPQTLTKTLGPTATKQYGIGTDTMGCDTLGEGTFGHGAASAATFLISPSNDLVIVMCRNSAGRNFDKYHPEFLRTVAEVMNK